MTLDSADHGFQPVERDIARQGNGAESDYDRAKGRLVVALDKATAEEARTLVTELAESVGVFKVGLELVMAPGGLSFARELADRGAKVFLDMKFYDIGNTVELAVANVAKAGFEFVTVHGLNRKTLDAAVRGRGSVPRSSLKLLAVTVLTNHDMADLREGNIRAESISQIAIKRALMAEAAGFDGVIASGHEVKEIRAAVSSNFIIKVPGIRPTGAPLNDQTRSMTPTEARRLGADYLVVGRPIYQSANPKNVADMIVEEIRQAG